MNRISRAADALGIRFPRNARAKIAKLLAVLIAISGLAIPLAADAATLSPASLTLSDPQPSVTGVSYTFTASGQTTATTIECIQEVYSVNPDGTGGVPTGMSTSSATLDTGSTFITPANWGSNVSATNGTVVFQYVTGATPAAGSNNTFILDNVTNSSAASTSGYYMTFTTYTSTGSGVCAGTAVDSATVGFVITQGSTLSLTVNGSLSFTVAGVANNTTCDGTTTDNLSGASATANTLAFGTVAPGTPELLCQALTAATNSTNGFTVYLRFDKAPTNALGQTIAVTSGTNAAPTTFGNSNNSQGVYGYTTNDQALGTGTANRFYNGTAYNWAAPTTTNEEVAYSGTGVSTVTYDVGHQVQTTTTTEPGTYQDTIIYTCTPVY